MLGYESFDKVLNHFTSTNQTPTCFVIGGSSIYKEAMHLTNTKSIRIFLTSVQRKDGSTIQCDTFFPDLKEFKDVNGKMFCERSLKEFLVNDSVDGEAVWDVVKDGIVEENGFVMEFMLFEKKNE